MSHANNIPDVKLWFWQEFESHFVEEGTIDCFNDQVEEDDDEEVEDDESIHLLADDGLSAGSVTVLSPVNPDQEDRGADKEARENKP